MNEAQPLKVSIKTTRADFAAFSKAVYGELNLFSYRAISLVVAVIVVFTLDEFLSGEPWVRSHILNDYSLVYYGVLALLYLVLVSCIFGIIGKNIRYIDEGQGFLRPKQISIDAAGLEETSDVSKLFMSWRGIARIVKNKKHMLFYVDRMQAFVIPLRDFESAAHATAFYEQALAFWKAAQATSPVAP